MPKDRTHRGAISKQLLGILLIVLLLVGIATTALLIAKQRDTLMVADAVEDASIIAESLTELRNHQATDEIEHMLVEGMASPRHFETETVAAHEHRTTSIRLFSAFPWREDGGPRDAFETEALGQLQRHPDYPFYRVVADGEGRRLRFAVAERMQPNCVRCHAGHSDSPKADWQAGDMAGVLAVSIPLSPEHARLHNKMDESLILAGVLLTLLVAALALFYLRARYSIFEMESMVEKRTRSLRRTQRSLAEAQRIGQIGNWDWDMVHDHLWLSEEMHRLFGIPMENFDHHYKTLLDVVDPNDSDARKVFAEKAIREGGPCEMEYHIILPDGTRRLIEERAEVFLDEEGKAVRAVGMARDVTEQRRAEEALQLLTQALEQAGESVVITDTDGLIEYVNRSFTEVTGYRLEEAVGKNPRILQSGRQDADFYRRMWQEIRNSGTWKGRIWNKRKNGEVYPEQLHIRAVRNERGEITHYVGVFSDITEQLSLEEQLRHSQKMEAIGTLAGGIAHDFNNILAAITGNLYLVKHEFSDMPEVVSRIEIMEEESFRAASLVSQLLTFARKDIVQMKNLSFTELARGSIHLSRVGIPEDVSLKWDVCDEELPVWGDESQLKQIILNLVNNARDAVEGRERGEIKVTVGPFEADKGFCRRHPAKQEQRFVCLRVEDNGTGISKEELPYIFDPFFTTKDVGRGTGLGLSMLYGSVQHHHGFVEVESEPGRGSIFSVYLPLVEAKSEKQESPEAVLPGRGEGILVVDDESMVRNIARKILENLGYRVLEASNGAMALDVYNRNSDRIDLVLLDVIMPEMGGVEAAEEIRKMRSDIPIIFATGYDRERILDEVMHWHRVSVLNKPYHTRTLSIRVRELLDEVVTPES